MSAAAADSDPLLSTALEKLLYLESRLEWLEAARDQAEKEGARHQERAERARRAMAEWQRRAAEAEVSAENAQSQVAGLRAAIARSQEQERPAEREQELVERLEEAQRRIERFARERETWLDRMVALDRLRRGDEDDRLDLGAFIAELRAELMSVRRGTEDRRLPERTQRPRPDELLEQAPPTPDVEQLLAQSRLSRPERTLAGLCARELESPSPTLRRRALERLLEAGIGTLNPLVASKLGTESDPGVRTTAMRLVDRTGGAGARLVLERGLTDDDPRVRTAALEGLSRRPDFDPTPALSDRSPAVRRRALALLRNEGASIDHLAAALRDDDPTVRRVAILALCGHSGREVEAILQVAAKASDESVRKIAREALARRGIAETEAAPALPPAEEHAFDHDEAMLDEVRISLRGCSLEDLSQRLGLDEEALAAAVERLVNARALVWRGRRLYLP